MPSININEYDHTIVGPAQYEGNITAIPLNATDGPADKWITVTSYEEFVQLFGPNPSTDPMFGSSWEYAANLLLRGMPVCVRRITHELTNNGENTTTLLNGVNTAKTIIKLKDVVGGDNSYNFAEAAITFTDPVNNTKLSASYVGDVIPNDCYIKNTITSDGNSTSTEFPNALSLQKFLNVQSEITLDNIHPEAFADVTNTNSEWNFVGEHINTHLKFINDDAERTLEYATPIEAIHAMDQLKDEHGEPYVEGDFFIEENTTHVIKFTNVAVANEYYIPNNVSKGLIVTYPSELASIKLDSTKTDIESYFINVTYDANNENKVNHVWVYSKSNNTLVANKQFKNGNVIIEDTDAESYEDIRKEGIKAFANKNDLPKNPINGDFAVIATIKDKTTKYSIYKYSSHSSDWLVTTYELDDLINYEKDGNLVAIKVYIPFVCIDKPLGTGVYKKSFNWYSTGESYENYVDNENPELVYLPQLYWENTKNPIGTRPHTQLINAKINHNNITVRTNNNTTTTNLKLEINETSGISSNIAINSDSDESHLTSGYFGITNISLEPIKIYNFVVKQISTASTNSESIIYDMGLSRIPGFSSNIIVDPLLSIYNPITQETSAYTFTPQLDVTDGTEKYYVELNPGCRLFYNRNITSGSLSVDVVGFDSFDITMHACKSSVGSYDINLSTESESVDTNSTTIIKQYIPVSKVKEEINYEDIKLADGVGNFNLFTAEYLYPGTNGNHVSLKLKTDSKRGIYIYVYRDNQHLETIELCSFRWRDGNSGRVHILDMELNKMDIWYTILLKFGLAVVNGEIYKLTNVGDLNIVTSSTVLDSLYGNYVKININPKILEYDAYKSYDYLDAIYAETGINIFKLTDGRNPSDEHVYHEVNKCFTPLNDKYRFDITFITSGTFIDPITYPKNIVYSYGTDTQSRLIEDSLIDTAHARKDCVAFLDVPYDLPIEDVPYYFEHLSTSYAAAYDPWGYIALETGTTKWMPPSFVQLYTHAKSIKNGNQVYLPPAGVKRAQVPEIIQTNHDLPSNYMTDWQNNDTPQFINPILWINGYDYTIYGQKTLYNVVDGFDKYQSALQDLNVRLVANDIKKLIFKTCISLTFELNNMYTWNEFKSKIEPKLSTMLGEGVLTDYNIIMGTETMTSADLNSGHIVGTVKIAVARAATDWDINFELTPNAVTFSEFDYNSSYNV